jgi:Rha family phage regulatory protein
VIKLKRREITPVLVSNKGGKLKTDSLIVARVCERRHDHLLRDIKNVIDSDAYQQRIKNGTLPNFELCFRINALANGKKEPYYEMDRQGFEILAMGFTGEKALEWKFKYSDAFSAMEELLKKERIVIQDNPFDLEELSLGLLQVRPEQRQTAKQIRCRWVNILQNSIGCGHIWVCRLTNEIYQSLLNCPQANARNFRQHMNLPLISAVFLTRDQLEGHIQSFVTDIELSAIRLYSLNREITFGEIRTFMLGQAKMYHKQLLRIAQRPPSSLVFDHEYNVTPILPYRERRMQRSQAA